MGCITRFGLSVGQTLSPGHLGHDGFTGVALEIPTALGFLSAYSGRPEALVWGREARIGLSVGGKVYNLRLSTLDMTAFPKLPSLLSSFHNSRTH